MTDPLALAREDILALEPYAHACWDPGLERLHANESPWRCPSDATRAGLNRYPEPQPKELVAALAALYDVPTSRLLLGRGSDEGIDLLVRAFCVAGRDSILVCPPTFGMYAVAARIQDASVTSVPLRRDRDYSLDAAAMLTALTPNTKLIFVCTPNNPTGNSLDPVAIEEVLRGTEGRALVVIDEAYAEFSTSASWAAALSRWPHLVVLRTLSKAQGLAGARVGCVLADPRIIELLRKIIPPYAIAQTTVEAALLALSPSQLFASRERVALLCRERDRIASRLARSAAVLRVWPSDANFLLVDFENAENALARFTAAGLLVRDQRRQGGLERALRITVGTPEQNDRIIASLT